MSRWLSLIVEGPLFVLRVGLVLFRVYALIAVAVTSIGMVFMFIALLLAAFGIRWGW